MLAFPPAELLFRRPEGARKALILGVTEGSRKSLISGIRKAQRANM